MARKIRKNNAGTKQTGAWAGAEIGFLTEKGWCHLSRKNPHWALKAIVMLYNRQTEDEQRSRTTYRFNDRGFNCADASRGTRLAKVILWLINAPMIGSYRQAAREMAAERPRDLELAFRLCCKYRKQCLNFIAKANDSFANKS